jgi:hypothetical protein
MATFVFECNSNTYFACVEESVFGSNKPWPFDVRTGDYCLLHHLDNGGLLGLWQATSDGGRNLVPKLWGGKFPFQVTVKLFGRSVVAVDPLILAKLGIDPVKGRFPGPLDEEMASEVLEALRDTAI